MKREAASDLSQIATHDTQAYADATLDSTEPPLIFGSNTVPSSTKHVELIEPQATSRPTVAPLSSRAIRLLDVAVALSLLIFVLPLMLLCALAISLTSRGPVIFSQVRIGRGGREFTCFKFRTMTQFAEASINSLLVDGSPLQEEWATIYKLRADPRVTRFGRFMRRYSLDELPQLFNVLRGDMSIVGPRPIVAAEIHRYGDHFADYYSVNPGITGLWQVSGRHANSYDERVRLDAEYAQNKSVPLDLLILWKTVPVVFHGQNE